MKEGASIVGELPEHGQTGHRGGLRLSFGRRGERTVLGERFASAPFGVVRANYPDGSGMAEVQITNPSGGILGGDHLEMDVAVAPDASATVITQAANKAYRGAESSQQAIFRVEGGAFLEYLPHHLIPYPGSDYRQRAVLHLAPEATLITWDAFAAGRVARGERFAFTRLRSRTGDPQGWRTGSYRRFRPSRWLRAFWRLLVLGCGIRPCHARPRAARGESASSSRWYIRHARLGQRTRSGPVRGTGTGGRCTRTVPCP
ncbi:MAG: urease accessory protein UreD [Rubrobacter sp.]|nr:urease accessory protein UreD [Rubrobacter sp.]